MKRIKGAILQQMSFLFVCMMLSLLSLSAFAAGCFPFTGFVTYDKLTVRKEPSKNAEAIAQLVVDSSVTVLEQVSSDERYWYKIQYQKMGRIYEGYVLYDYVERSTSLQV